MHANFFPRFLISVSCVIGVIYFSFSAVVAAERQHGAHVHGEGALNVAINGETVVVELVSPAANVLGFEHMPRSEAEEETVHKTVEQLRQADKIILFPENAGCHPVGVAVDGEVVDHVMAEHEHDTEAEKKVHEGEHHHDNTGKHEEHDHHDDDGDGHEHTHSEITASYEFSCNTPDRLTSAEVQLFRMFPGFEKIFVQVMSPKGQNAATLTSAESNLSF